MLIVILVGTWTTRVDLYHIQKPFSNKMFCFCFPLSLSTLQQTQAICIEHNYHHTVHKNRPYTALLKGPKLSYRVLSTHCFNGIRHFNGHADQNYLPKLVRTSALYCRTQYWIQRSTFGLTTRIASEVTRTYMRTVRFARVCTLHTHCGHILHLH